MAPRGPAGAPETGEDDGFGGGRLSPGLRLWRGAALASVLAAPALAVPGVPETTRLGMALVAVLAGALVALIPWRSALYPPPPVADLGYAVILVVAAIAITGIRAEAEGLPAPALFDALAAELDIPHGPLAFSEGLGPVLGPTHAAVIAAALGFSAVAAAVFFASPWPRPGHRAWARGFGETQRAEARRGGGSRFPGTGALRYAVLTLVAIWFPLEPGFVGPMIALRVVMTPARGGAVLLILKGAAITLLMLYAVAHLRLRITGTAPTRRRREPPRAGVHPIVAAQMQEAARRKDAR